MERRKQVTRKPAAHCPAQWVSSPKDWLNSSMESRSSLISNAATRCFHPIGGPLPGRHPSSRLTTSPTRGLWPCQSEYKDSDLLA
ncbi:hypothetical protein HNY73_000787 [Argiope bruennichi]|uniref:Uncharacterized protein n=1 Tax=Argiope bruennichi TaxID=94029 RepID=A0A8T0G2Y7_ARGBR|nr:hypothetical protein HNY73_000787 [Argiope bruennichi]